MMRGKNRASGLVQQTETPAVMTVVDLSRHWTMTMRVVKTANTDHHGGSFGLLNETARAVLPSHHPSLLILT